MDIKTIANKLNTIKPGTFVRCTYITELPVKAEYKKLGYKVTKVTSMTTRFGIHYGNIKEVKEKNKEENNNRKVNENLEWIIKDSIQYNKNTENYYLCTYPTIKGRNSKSRYIVEVSHTVNDGKCFDKDGLFDKSIIINSYWNKKPSNMMKININNILNIGGYK